MSILFGHPTGNPNSHHAALAHFEHGRLEAFVVPWMPTLSELQFLNLVKPLRPMVQRLGRRRFVPLEAAPKVQGRWGEYRRQFIRALGKGDEGLSYQVNDWLMRTMARECRRARVTAVHCYEDASLCEFKEAKRLGKACIYDMPIGYYPAWERTQAELARRYADWLPPGELPSNRFVRPEQKRQEMALADLVLVPSTFVQRSIEQFIEKRVALAPYAVDLEFWQPTQQPNVDGPLRFIFAGQSSLRKGIPVLLEAWRKAALKDAELELVGTWEFDEGKKRESLIGVTFIGPVPPEQLRDRFQGSDVLVFPSFFEGRALVVGEALACGLPVLTSDASGWDDMLDDKVGRVFPAGNKDALVEELRWFATHRERLPKMGVAARRKAETYTWDNYRCAVSDAVAPYV